MTELMTENETVETAEDLVASSKPRAETFGAQVSVNAFEVKGELRISLNLFAPDSDSADKLGKEVNVTAARIAACSAMFAKYGKKTTSSIYVSSPNDETV